MNQFVGVGTLIQLILRRDRVILPGWILLSVLIVIGIAASIPAAYPTPAARQAFADETMSNPTEIVMIGPVFVSSVGGLAAWRVRGNIALILALASLFAV